LQGRDGIGAAPCCGTGVVYRRDALLSVGGQAYGSVTEDYNTTIHLMAAGFASMYLNERLVFGMVPEDVPGGYSCQQLVACKPAMQLQQWLALPAGCATGCEVLAGLMVLAACYLGEIVVRWRHQGLACTHTHHPGIQLIQLIHAPTPAGTFRQRLRWAMGALQILYRSNPLRIPGLTTPQALLFWESAASNWTAIPALIMALMPVV
jgi:cellulose synthase/poly-beta-1,6-N-acetylglucosamine synthase-like glycosyltransferase